MIERNNLPSELCFIAPYCEILNHIGYHVSEDFLFGITGGIGFRYSYIHENKQEMNYIDCNDWVSIEGSIDIKEGIEEIFGVRFKENVVENRDAIFELCRNEIQKLHPVILFLDVFYLPYHPQFKQLHGQTNVLLYKIGEDETCYIYDKHVTTVPISVYDGAVSKDVLMQALICGDNPFNGREIGVITYEEFEFKSSVNLGEQLKYVVNRILEPKNPNEGIEGMKNLAEQVLNWGQLWDIDNLKNVYRQAYYHITGRGGTYITSKAFASYVKNYIVSQTNNDRDVLKDMEKCTSLWQALAAKLFRNSIKPGREVLQETASLLLELSYLEEHSYKK